MTDKRERLFSGNTAILINCIGIAFLFFILTKLSKSYTDTVVYNVNYVDYPSEKVPSRPLQNQLNFTLKTSGYNLLSIQLFKNNIIDFPLSNFQNQNFILTNKRKSFISDLLGEEYEIIQIQPDTINLYFSNIVEKKVPVKVSSKIKFAPQHDAMEPLITEPDSVTVKGPESRVNALSFWPTDSLFLNNLKETQQGFLAVQQADSLQIDIQPNRIKYLQTVEEFTEAIVTVPVEIRNEPKNSEIIIFPKKVNIQYQVGLSNFEKSKQDIFEIVADFKDINIKKKKSITLKIEKIPGYIKKYKLQPNSVDFILYED